MEWFHITMKKEWSCVWKHVKKAMSIKVGQANSQQNELRHNLLWICQVLPSLLYVAFQESKNEAALKLASCLLTSESIQEEATVSSKLFSQSSTRVNQKLQTLNARLQQTERLLLALLLTSLLPLKSNAEYQHQISGNTVLQGWCMKRLVCSNREYSIQDASTTYSCTHEGLTLQ